MVCYSKPDSYHFDKLMQEDYATLIFGAISNTAICYDVSAVHVHYVVTRCYKGLVWVTQVLR